ncbi:unnamed protein product [Polarella glacialis]|uniref:Uncharacterized protein n=1 Tax=Polarella glacialis TaxID=89957 RepID=A0A813G0M0_POLGL|nr:unnamed protein product [Polarella glacialis]
MCDAPSVIDYDASGLPCQDNSQAGNQQKEQGRTNVVYITWARFHVLQMTVLLCVENTPEISLAMLQGLLGVRYFLYQLFVDCSDVGRHGATRARTYVFCLHKVRGRYLTDIFELYYALKDRVSETVATRPSDYMIASREDILMEASEIAKVRKKDFRPLDVNLAYLLTDREEGCRQQYDSEYYRRFGKRPATNPDLCYYLRDEPSWSLTWSATSKRIPTYRTGSGKMWFPFYNRFIVSRDILASMGFPVSQSVALAMGVPQVPMRDPKRAGDLAGNAMHLTSCFMVQICGLVCFGKRPHYQLE